jgi:periplasmic protein TonB
MRDAAISAMNLPINSGASVPRTTSSPRGAGQAGSGLALLSRQPTLGRSGPGRIRVIAAIVLLHALLIWGLQTMSFKAIRSEPAALSITLVAADQAKAPPKTVTVHRTAQKLQYVAQQAVAPVTDTAVSAIAATDDPPAPVVPIAPTDKPVQSPPLVAEPKTISSGVEYIRAPKPVYPALSRRMREQGRAVVRVLVDKNGLPENATIAQSAGSARLDEAARQAVLSAVFKPLLENGLPVPVYALVPIRFQLDS